MSMAEERPHVPRSTRKQWRKAPPQSQQDVEGKATKGCRLFYRRPLWLLRMALKANLKAGVLPTIPCVLARAAGWLDRVAFSPDTLPDDLVMGLALAPTVAAGLIIFKLAALEMLFVALIVGIVGQ